MISTIFKEKKHYLIPAAIMVLGIFASAQNLAFYLHFDFNFFLVLLVAPLVVYIEKPGNFSLRFGILSIILLASYPLIKIQSLYYLGFMCFILFVAESFIGKVNNLTIILIILFSPFIIFVFETFSFPIRLKLTEAAARIISAVGIETSAQGNVLLLNKSEFRTDPECLGLRMITTSLLILLIFISHYSRKWKVNISPLWIAILLSVCFFLIVIANLIRIVTIVIFKAMPDTLSHELIGIGSLFLYVIIPLFFIVKFIIKKYSHTKDIYVTGKLVKYKIVIPVTIVLLCSLIFLNINREKYRNIKEDKALNNLILPGFSKTIVTDGVVKFENRSALVYIKPSCNFYGAYHSPLICWKGSGTTFSGEQVVQIKGIDISTSEMKYKNDTLYTAWWFDNGQNKTIGQLDWRWRMIKGEKDYRLINITCLNKQDLFYWTEKLLEKELF